MRLSSCTSCGIVVDLDQKEPEGGWEPDGFGGECMDDGWIWDGGEPKQSWKCPVCNEKNVY